MWRVLRRHDFALLWTGGLLSIAGNWSMVVGLPLYVYDQTGSTLATGGAFLVAQIPQVLFGSVAGVFADRWDRKRTLVVANLLLAVVLFLMLGAIALEVLALLYVAMFLVASIQQVVTPSEDALLPRLIGGSEDLVPANALNALNNNLARLGGPPIGALLYAWAGLTGVVAFDLVTFLTAALLISRIRTDARPAAPEDGAEDAGAAWAGHWAEWLAGLRMVRTRRRVAVLIGFAALAGLGEGTMSALLVPFVREVLDAPEGVFGIILSAQAVGSLMGGLVIGRWGRFVTPRVLAGVGALGLAAFDAAIFVYPAFLPGSAIAIGLFLLVGLPVSAMLVGIATLRQTSVPDAFRGRLMGTGATTFALTAAVGTSIAGFLGEFVPLVPLLMTQVAMYAAGGLVVLGAFPRSEDRV